MAPSTTVLWSSRSAHHRWTSTEILQCVSTLTVSLPRTIAEMPWRPCEAMTIRSQPFDDRRIDDRLVGMFVLDMDRLA